MFTQNRRVVFTIVLFWVNTHCTQGWGYLGGPWHNAIFTSRKGAKINFEFKRFKTIDNSQGVFLVSKDVFYHILSIFECAMKIGNFFPSLIFYKFLKNENVGWAKVSIFIAHSNMEGI